MFTKDIIKYGVEAAKDDPALRLAQKLWKAGFTEQNLYEYFSLPEFKTIGDPFKIKVINLYRDCARS